MVSLQKSGGGALDCLEFSNGLAKKGFVHDAVISAGNEYPERWAEYAEYRTVTKIPTYRSSMKSFLFWTVTFARPVHFVRAVLKAEPDIIHVVNFHPWVIFLFLMRPFAKYKVFCAFQDNPYDPKEKIWPLSAVLERFFARNADAVIVYSEFMKNDIGKYIKNKPVEVLPLGIYGGLCPGMADKQFHTEGKFNILFFGRIEPYKGVDILVGAMDILSKERVDVELTLAGKGKISEHDLKLIARLKIDLKNYWISDAELCSLVARADVLVAPYKKATQSGVISVGLACHMPLIVTRVGAFPEYVEDGSNGFLIEPDARDLAEKIKILYGDRKLLAKMSRGAEKMAETFSWTAIADRAIRWYGNGK